MTDHHQPGQPAFSFQSDRCMRESNEPDACRNLVCCAMLGASLRLNVYNDSDAYIELEIVDIDPPHQVRQISIPLAQWRALVEAIK